jgi:C4-dicarboxylate-binding protein DctP
MHKGLIGCIVLFVLLSTPALAESFNVAISQAREISNPQRLATGYFIKLLEERSQGEIRVTLTRTSDRLLSSLTQQRLQLALVNFPESISRLPQLKFLQLPFLFRDRQHLYQVLDSEVGREILQTDSQLEFIPLSVWDLGFRQLATNEPVLPPEQTIELDITAQQGDTTTTLKQKIEARWQINPDLQYSEGSGYDMLLSELAQKQLQQASNLTLSSHLLSGCILIVDRMFWDDMPEDLKVIVEGAIKDATLYFRELAQQDELQALRKLESDRLEIHRLSPAQQKSWQTELQKAYPRPMSNSDLQIVKSILQIGLTN